MNLKVGLGKRKNSYILFGLLIVFMSIFNNGNLNLMYFCTPIIVIMNFRNMSVFKNLYIWFVPFLLIFFMTMLFSPFFNNISKSLIYLLKIFVCIVWFKSMSTIDSKVNMRKMCDFVCLLIFVLTIAAIFYQKEPLWRLHDTINYYSETRLQLFFMEPSELSEVSGVFLISQLFLFKKYRNKTNLIFAIGLLIPLFLSAGLSGIVYTTISVFFFAIISEYKKIKNGKISKLLFYSIIVIVFFTIYIFLVAKGNPIISRIEAVIAGNDGSFNYRYVRAIDALRGFLTDSHLLGIGLGNLRTQITQVYLTRYALLSFSNSYLFFIAEGGIIAIMYLLNLIVFAFKRVQKLNYTINKAYLWSLLLFIVAIQITGGYFTDPFLWSTTGFICFYNIEGVK